MEKRMSIQELSDVYGGNCVVYNSRGNGSGGPGTVKTSEVKYDLTDEEIKIAAEIITLVSETDDPSAWTLARETHEAIGFDPPTIVCVGDEDHGDGEYAASNPNQAIYSV